MKTSRIISIHIIFWVFFVIAPTLMFRLDPFHKGPDLSLTIYIFLINILTFYLTYWFFIPILMKRKSMLLMVGIGLLWFLAIVAIRLGINYLVKDVFNILSGKSFRLEKQIMWDSFGALMFMLYPVLIYFSIEWFRERKYRFELAREKQKSEIDLLKFQMSPHFLMNTLNNLYSLVYQGSKKASEAVLKLSDIMRYMLYDTGADFVALEKEVKYLQSFIEIQMLRFKNQEMVDFITEGDFSGRMIAPMIFIPFVENAFKHGNKHLPGMGISVTILVLDDKITLEVMNFKNRKEIQKDAESGVGLTNVRKRLELEYPGRHVLEITDGVDYFKVYLEISDR